MATEMCSEETNFDTTVKAAAHHLTNCYDALFIDLFDHAFIAENARKCCQLYCSLNRSSPQWKVKPILFFEITELSMTRPSAVWTYGVRRSNGTDRKAKRWHEDIFSRFCARHNAPALP